jgi:small-conductance mechanosensitive channel
MKRILIAEGFFDYLDQQTILGVTLSTLLWLVAIAIIAIILERVITRYLRKFAKRARLAPNVANSLILTFRLLILIGALASLIRAGGLPTEWLVAFSALGGAAVGFASTKTIGNFIAGLYLFAARPFRAGDYVRVGTVEGIVEEMTINYTKILTIGNNVVSISNLQMMDRDITNYLYDIEESTPLYCYTFEIAFDHSVSTDKIGKIFEQAFEQYRSKLPKNPNYMLLRSGGFERVFMIYLYVKKPEDIFTLRPEIAKEVFNRWDKERAKTVKE